MSVRLVTIASFGQPEDAYVARNQLERRGIAAVVTEAISAGALRQWGAATGGTRLLVNQVDAKRAREFLLEAVSNPAHHDLSGYWRCLPCQEIVDPGFDLCWSCSRRREEVQDEAFQPTLAQVVQPIAESFDESDAPLVLLRPTVEAEGESQANPYSPSGAQYQVVRSPITIAPPQHLNDIVIRAWRASVIGIFVCPPVLNLYSMYLLIRVSFQRPTLSSKANRRFYAALVVNILVGSAVGFYRWFEWLQR